MEEALPIALGVAAGLGLAAASGLRVFLPAFLAGVGMRFFHLEAADGFAWASSTPALIALGTATALEIGAYYVPWLDNLLDTVATPASVVAGALVSAALFVGLDPFAQWTAAIIAGGGVAGTVQGGTVVARALSTGTTGGLANPLVSTAENVLALGLALLSLVAPLLALAAVVVVLAIALRRIWRFWSRRSAGEPSGA